MWVPYQFGGTHVDFNQSNNQIEWVEKCVLEVAGISHTWNT